MGTSGGFRGAQPVHALPTTQNFLNFMQFFAKFGEIICWRSPPGGLMPPPTGNPGSAPGNPKSMNKLTLNEPAISVNCNARLERERYCCPLFSNVNGRPKIFPTAITVKSDKPLISRRHFISEPSCSFEGDVTTEY